MSGLVTAMASGGSGLSGVAFTGIILKAVAFLGITVGLGHYLSGSIMRLAARMSQPDIILVVGLAICFALAFVAERIGLAGIVGAFAAGLLLDPYGEGVRTVRSGGDALEAAVAHLQRVRSVVLRADGHPG